MLGDYGTNYRGESCGLRLRNYQKLQKKEYCTKLKKIVSIIGVQICIPRTIRQKYIESRQKGIHALVKV